MRHFLTRNAFRIPRLIPSACITSVHYRQYDVYHVLAFSLWVNHTRQPHRTLWTASPRSAGTRAVCLRQWPIGCGFGGSGVPAEFAAVA
ncbi:hypothetical protein NUW54_g2239 [Trametes sanguinea]|uniref:Uncharacterized protein n=1 Tax=Trametes sanguinea TaxID=158606 RepID=A0ACC1Q5F5_9APHY|nr:hypothetical protein NUW54_g2239 [Trametes sanguinea]